MLLEEEAFYLEQIGLITVSPECKFGNPKNFLYSYLRRGGKIVKCGVNLNLTLNFQEFEFYCVYDTLEDYRDDNISSVIRAHYEDKISFQLIEESIKVSAAIGKATKDANIMIAFVSGGSVTFMEINETLSIK